MSGNKKLRNLSLEKRKALIERNRRRIWTPEMRLKASQALLGRKQSLEHIEKKRLKSFGNRSRTGYITSLETRLKMSAAWKPSENRGHAIRKVWASRKIEERRRITGPAILASRITKPTSLEKAVADLLDTLEIRYEQEKQIGSYFVDFYLPSRKVVIEVDGHYWHNLPGRSEADVKRDNWLKLIGYKVVRIPERAFPLSGSSLLGIIYAT